MSWETHLHSNGLPPHILFLENHLILLSIMEKKLMLSPSLLLMKPKEENSWTGSTLPIASPKNIYSLVSHILWQTLTSVETQKVLTYLKFNVVYIPILSILIVTRDLEERLYKELFGKGAINLLDLSNGRWCSKLW